MRLDVIDTIRPAEICSLVVGLCPQLLLELAFGRVHGICEEEKVTACAFNIFLYLSPNGLVSEVTSPQRLIAIVQWVLVNLAKVNADLCCLC